MKHSSAVVAFVVAACLLGPMVQAMGLPPEVRGVLPSAALAGQATLRYWGFDVYQATLWVAPGFVDTDYAHSAFALELTYRRPIHGADIAKRATEEMRRQGSVSADVLARWEARMRALFPDVQAGDRITGVHLPQQGAVFWCNGRMLGEVQEPGFATRFFGIWLAAQTSEPQLRQALLSGTPSAQGNRP